LNINKMPKITTIISIIFISIVIGTTLKLTSAWVSPNVMPPGGNIAAPLNTSSYGQTKGGGLILNTLGAVYGLIVDKGNVGIGAQTPNQKLEVAGAIKIGNTEIAEPGTIRWTGTDFEGYNGTEWVNFWISGSGGGYGEDGGEDGGGDGGEDGECIGRIIEIVSAPGTLCGYSVKKEVEEEISRRESPPCGGIRIVIEYEDYVKCQGIYPSEGCPDGYIKIEVEKSDTEDNIWCVKE